LTNPARTKQPRERSSPTKCGKNIVVARWANDQRTKAAGSGGSFLMDQSWPMYAGRGLRN
jgi:hypothetical protein